jgi:hypothetical protein
VKKANAAILAPDRPIPNSYWVIPGQLLAGEHPSGALEGAPGVPAGSRLQQMLLAGIDCFIDLTEEGELPDYRGQLPENVDYLRFGIADMSVPLNVSQTKALVAAIRAALARERRVYVHWQEGGRPAEPPLAAKRAGADLAPGPPNRRADRLHSPLASPPRPRPQSE